MALAGPWIADSTAVKGGGPADPSTGAGKAFRARNISGDFADIGVILYDAAGNALLGSKVSASSVPVVIASDQAAVALKVDQTTPGTTDRVTVGGQATFANTVANTAATYAAGRAVGVLNTITGAVRTSGGAGVIQSVTLIDAANQILGLEVHYFEASIAAPTNNAAFNPSASDAAKYVGHVSVVAADWAQYSGQSVATKVVSIAVQAVGSANLYFVVVARGAQVFTANSLVVKTGVLQF